MKGLLLFTALILAATVSVAYSVTLLDKVVHGTLYNYGLQFSYDWATPYWTILRTILALVGVTAVFALATTIYVYRKYLRTKPEMKTTVSEEQVAPSVAMEPQGRSVSGLVRCSHCGRVFPQPLRMLNFHSDRPRMINICPFCNEIIQPVPSQEAEREKKIVQKEKKNSQTKVTRESQETVTARAQ